MIDIALGLCAAWVLMGTLTAMMAFFTYSKEEYLDTSVIEAILYYSPVAAPIFLLIRFSFLNK
jgi:hypothetical protein